MRCFLYFLFLIILTAYPKERKVVRRKSTHCWISFVFLSLCCVRWLIRTSLFLGRKSHWTQCGLLVSKYARREAQIREPTMSAPKITGEAQGDRPRTGSPQQLVLRWPPPVGMRTFLGLFWRGGFFFFFSFLFFHLLWLFFIFFFIMVSFFLCSCF